MLQDATAEDEGEFDEEEEGEVEDAEWKRRWWRNQHPITINSIFKDSKRL